MSKMDWYKLSVEESVNSLESDIGKGLTDAEVERRLDARII